jgi:hypothetical protein
MTGRRKVPTGESTYVDRWRRHMWDSRPVPPPKPHSKKPKQVATLKGSTLRLVLAALAEFADWDTGANVRPSQITLAEMTGLSLHSVSDYVWAAEQLGWIKQVGPRGNQYQGRATNYRLMFPRVDAATACADHGVDAATACADHGVDAATACAATEQMQPLHVEHAATASHHPKPRRGSGTTAAPRGSLAVPSPLETADDGTVDVEVARAIYAAVWEYAAPRPRPRERTADEVLNHVYRTLLPNVDALVAGRILTSLYYWIPDPKAARTAASMLRGPASNEETWGPPPTALESYLGLCEWVLDRRGLRAAS